MAWQQGVTALLLYQAQTITPMWCLGKVNTIKDRHPSFYKGILLYAPAAGSLLHGHVTAITK
mgnify:FL=1